MIVFSRLLLAGLACVFLAGLTVTEAHARKTIAMVVWIGCEDVCRGVKDYVTHTGIDADVTVFDAAQTTTRLPDIIRDIRAISADLVITWGTKVTLGITGSLADQHDPDYINELPVVFTVVSDPIGTGIIESYERTGRANVTGTRNRVPEAVNIKSMQRYLPGFSHLGMVYDPSAENSVGKVAEIQALADDIGFTLTALPLDLGSEGDPDPESIKPQMAALKAAGVQFVYLGSSAFLEKQSDLYTGAAVEAGLPVLSPYEHMVNQSEALMSVAARDYDVGRLAAMQAERILVDGEVPGDLPVEAITDFAYRVNMSVANQLKLFPPVEFLQFVEMVE